MASTRKRTMPGSPKLVCIINLYFPAPHRVAIICVCSEERCSVTSNVRLRADQQTIVTALAHFFLAVQKGGREMSAVSQPASTTDYKVADLNLADWGRKEIKIAETEMPGL